MSGNGKNGTYFVLEHPRLRESGLENTKATLEHYLEPLRKVIKSHAIQQAYEREGVRWYQIFRKGQLRKEAENEVRERMERTLDFVLGKHPDVKPNKNKFRIQAEDEKEAEEKGSLFCAELYSKLAIMEIQYSPNNVSSQMKKITGRVM